MLSDFSAWLLLGSVLTGAVWCFDVVCWRRARFKRLRQVYGETDDLRVHDRVPFVVEQARAFFPVLVLVFFLRSFLVEPFRIPSGSMEPTLLTGDFIVVNKFTYGIRLPILHRKIWPLNEPDYGDIVVFRYPVSPSVHYIKRVVGLPGDTVSYVQDELYVNGRRVDRQYENLSLFVDHTGRSHPVQLFREDLLGASHPIFLRQQGAHLDMPAVVVPDGHYFVMGDNRNDSQDSRYWGFVPESHIVGKAMFVWLSWDHWNTRIRWERFGHAANS